MTAEMDKIPPSTSSTRRPLRRSRTITCNVYPVSPPVQENGTCDKRDVSPCEGTPPKSSCQALRHAVSALTRLDDFICEKIGAGYFSEVFKVTHRTTGQVMALKMNTMSSNRHNMLREVQLLNRLQHPNILRFMGVCVHEGQLHALIEFIEGGNLEQLLELKDEELPWIQRIYMTLGITKGLDYLHSKGYMHRDLTSKNILLKKECNHGYQAAIADFGLATKIPDPLSKEKLPTVGSPYWMAPEVLNSKFYCEKADLFSVGIIMCEITARISADPDVMPRMSNFGVDYVALSEMVSYCPLDYLQLAFKCCQVDPLKRPSSGEIIEWLEKIYKNLKNDIFTRQEKEKTERNGHKRSRSEDNILQVAESEMDTSSEDIVITPQLIGQVMSRDDPSYTPSSTNPFAAIQRFQYGRKLLGTSIDFAAELPVPETPPSTPGYSRGGRDVLDGLEQRRCQSLPSSPILLRRAAEKHHLESLHGSAHYCNQNHNQSGGGKLINLRARSKSTVFSDAFARRLQTELSLTQLPHRESLAESESPESPSSEAGGCCTICTDVGSPGLPSPAGVGAAIPSQSKGSATNNNNNNNSAASLGKPPPAPKRVNGGDSGRSGGGGGGCIPNPDPSPCPLLLPPSPNTTATRRRQMRRIKYQSLDGDAAGVVVRDPRLASPSSGCRGGSAGASLPPPGVAATGPSSAAGFSTTIANTTTAATTTSTTAPVATGTTTTAATNSKNVAWIKTSPTGTCVHTEIPELPPFKHHRHSSGKHNHASLSSPITTTTTTASMSTARTSAAGGGGGQGAKVKVKPAATERRTANTSGGGKMASGSQGSGGDKLPCRPSSVPSSGVQQRTKKPPLPAKPAKTK